MAGQLKVDSINADSNLSFRIANTAVAFIDSNGLRPTSGNLSLDSTGTTGIRLPSANTLAFFEGGVEAMRLDSSGNLLVGGTTQRLSAKITNNGSYWSGSGNSSGDAEYFLSNYATPAVAWAMSVRQDVGGANNDLKFLRLNSSGSFQDIAMQITQAEGNVNLIKNLGIGGATATTSGTGITFPATQSASSNANTLDDYEEGTWTPTFTLGGGSVTYTTRTGTYTKVGRLVTLQILIVVNTASSPSGTLEITSLPFTVNADSKGAIAMWSAGASGSATTAWAGTATPSTNSLRIYIYAGGGVSNPATLIVNGASFYVTASYEAA
jgi:hypothetical protein